MSAVDDAITFLQQRKKNLRCSELTGELEALGFRVRDGSKAGHKVVSHPGLAGFFGSSFGGGHGADGEVKPNYVGNMIRMLRTHQDALEEIMEVPGHD